MPKVVLTPIAMVVPTRNFVYAPSKLRPIIEVEESEVTQAQDILVSLAPDGKSNPTMTPTFVKSDIAVPGVVVVTDLRSFERYIKK